MAWTSADVGNPRTRPGLYVNFKKEVDARIRGGLVGVVAIAGQAAWGPDEKVQEIKNENDLINFYTKDETSPFDLPFMISQSLKGGASRVLAFRMEGASVAKGTLTLKDTTATPVDVITVNGKFNGARANDFTVTIAANPDNANRKDITLKEGSTVLRVWTTRVDNGVSGMIDGLVDQVNNDPDNYYITLTKLADGNDTLANISDSSLAGGADGDPIVAADYDAAMDALQIEDFSVFVTDTQDGTILTNIESWLKNDLRGATKQVIWVTGADTGDSVSSAVTDATGYNEKGIVYVYPGFKYKDFSNVEQTARGSKAAARIAGIIAGLQLSQSPTFREITDIVDVEVRLTHSQIQTSLAGGLLLQVWDGNKFKIERGINTLTILGTEDQVNFNKIQIVRIMDAIENTLRTTANDILIGKFLNNVDGQTAIIGLFGDFLNDLAERGVIDPEFTVEISPNNDSSQDRIFVDITVKPVDSVEFIFIDVQVQV